MPSEQRRGADGSQRSPSTPSSSVLAAARRALTLPLLSALVATGCGLAVAGVLDLGDLSQSGAYLMVAAALLAIGLYGSTSGIDVRQTRGHVKTVLMAVTVGVLLKAALISAVMYLAFGRPEYIVLGVAVAQIDPLSVAALRGDGRLSPRARSILSAWSSFDDPITVLLTVYFSALALRAAGRAAPTGADGAMDYVFDLVANAAFAAAVLLLWWLGRELRRRREDASAASGTGGAPPARRVLGTTYLGGLLALAAAQFLMLGIALVGLFFRPLSERFVDGLVRYALLVSSFCLGLLLIQGVSPVEGMVLGALAFLSQAVVSIPITRGLPRDDRISLALGQQNGITAIILALVLQPSFPETVAIVAPAILTANLLHFAANAAWNRARRRVPDGLSR
ncbi:cation:proton antiporter [Nocardiopsis sp. CNR-923]|uniref:cation:proton antiporter n=1 Tax=Nocardiopsis sp. CNR-923 TaxID=1904965 RepID=UPI00096A3507|nr:cation:proton antiporter [Nocardiopsis sp. CNR-923]